MNDTGTARSRSRFQGARTFWRDYRGEIFAHSDAILGYVTAIAALCLLTASPVARSRLDDLGSSAIAVCALGLTFVLTSLSLLSAILDTNVVQVLDSIEKRSGHRKYGLHGLVTAFRATAVIAAAGIIAWLAVRGISDSRLNGNGWETAKVLLGSLAIGLTVWLASAIVLLIGTIAQLLFGKAELLRQQDRRERKTQPGQSEERSA